MFEQLIKHREHIPPHLFWGLKHFKVELSSLDWAHLVECQQCQDVLDLVLQAATFGEALVAWSKHYRDGSFAA
jgi:hypothetical protein